MALGRYMALPPAPASGPSGRGAFLCAARGLVSLTIGTALQGGGPMINFKQRLDFKQRMELQSPTGPVVAVAAGLAVFLAAIYLVAA